MNHLQKLSVLGLVLLCLNCVAQHARAGFIYGGMTPYSGLGADSLNKAMYGRLGFNAIEGLVDTPGSATIGIDKYASEGWRTWGVPYNSQPEFGCVYSTGREARLIHIEAEDTSSLVNWYGVTTKCYHHEGSVDGPCWYVDPADSSHHANVVAWELHDYYQALGVHYSALFYMKIDTIGNPLDEVARIEFVTPLSSGDSTFESRIVRSSDFPGSNQIWPVTVDDYDVTWLDDSNRVIQGPLRSDIRVYWMGTRKLSMDSVVIFNEAGKQLARDLVSPRRDSILAQAARYASVSLPDSLTDTPTVALNWWLGYENNWDSTGNAYMDMMEPAKILDNLLATSYDQGFLWDRNLTGPSLFEAEDDVYFRQDPRHFLMWDYSMVPELDPGNLAVIQSKYDHITASLLYGRQRCDSVGADFHYVANAFAVLEGDTIVGQDTFPRADLARPTSAELKCMSFLGLAYGIDGLWYWPYDDRVLSFRGLYLKTGDTTTARTAKYYAVRDTVSPVVSVFSRIIDSLEWRGAGLIASVVSTPWSCISDFESTNLGDNYVEVGQYSHEAGVGDYLLLVNRNTSTDTSRELRITLDAAKLSSPAQVHYYVINLCPAYQASPTLEDTTLAGPLDGQIQYATTLEPGGATLLKIVAAPSRIAGTTFPTKWWGAIQANEGVSLSAGRSLEIDAGSHVSIHTECGYVQDYEANFNIDGKFTARGTSDSGIVFDKVYDGPPDSVQCFGGDCLLWGGLVLGGSQACTLAYCEIRDAAIAVKSVNVSLTLDHVTTTNASTAACDLTGASGTFFSMNDCTFDGLVKFSGGVAELIGVDILGVSDGLWAGSSATCALQDVSVQGFTGTGLKFQDGAYGNLHDVSLLFGGIGMIISGATAAMEDVTIGHTDTALYSDPGAGAVVTARLLRAAIADKGLIARSGELRLDSCRIISTALSAIEAYSGSALVRMDSCYVRAPSQAADVSIGSGARLVATRCTVDSGYIGFEVAGDGADSITNCRVINNNLYGIWWNGGNSVGDSADYSANNVISNMAATDLNVGFQVLQQSIESEGDSVKGGYNWDYNLNTYNTSGKAARISEAAITGKSGDDWGLVLNGIGSSSDSAFVSYTTSNDLFSQANVYVRQIHAEITHSHFVSSGAVGSPPYGILERDGTSGFVGCTWAKNQRTSCVKREGSTSQLIWTELLNGNAGNNTFCSNYGPAKYFANYGTDSVDVRQNYWGSKYDPGSRLEGPVKYLPFDYRDDCDIEVAKVAALEETTLPLAFALEQNHPNPFNPVTTIDFSLPTEQPAQLDLFNVLGQRVRSFNLGSVSAGVHSVTWNGTTDYGLPVGSGLYFYRLTTPLYTSTKKMMFLK